MWRAVWDRTRRGRQQNWCEGQSEKRERAAAHYVFYFWNYPFDLGGTESEFELSIDIS